MNQTGETPDPASISRDLQALGFSDYEARAYLALLNSPAVTAYEVSKLASLPRANSYSVLESLTKKQAAQPVSENPTRYVANTPDLLLARIAKRTQEQCDRLSSSLAKLVRPKEENENHVWSISGHKEITAKIIAIIESARTHIWIKTSKAILIPFQPLLDQAATRGVKILIILFGDHPEDFKTNDNIDVYLHESTGVPVGTAHHLVTLTRDFDEALTAHMGNTPYGAYTRNRPLVILADTLIRHEIYFAEIFARFGPSIQDAFGPDMIELRKRFLPADQARLWDQMVTERANTTGRANGTPAA